MMATSPQSRLSERDHEAESEDEAQRDDGETKEAVDGETDHPPPAVLGLTGVALVAVVRDRGLPESDPGEHPPQVPVRLAHSAHHIRDPPPHQAEVSGIHGELHVREAMHDPVEGVGGPEFHAALPGAPAADGVHHLVALAPKRDHLEHHLRRILQIAIDQDDSVALNEVEPRRDRELVAEVPGQKEELDPLVASAQLAHHLAAAVGAAVVHEDELAVAVDVPGDGVEAAVQLWKHILLVAHRHDERDLVHG